MSKYKRNALTNNAVRNGVEAYHQVLKRIFLKVFFRKIIYCFKEAQHTRKHQAETALSN